MPKKPKSGKLNLNHLSVSQNRHINVVRPADQKENARRKNKRESRIQEGSYSDIFKRL